jgi:hypothetical protein
VDLSKCNQEQFSLKTSKDSSQAKCQMELFASNGQSKDWKQWGIKLRQEYSQRVKLAHLTRENESLSWPTASTRDHKGGYEGGRIRNGKISMDALDVAAKSRG